jgi:hypothetical protein
MSQDETLKPEDVADADHVIGPFRLVVRASGGMFETLLTEVRDGWLFYVRLTDDPRFDWLGPIVRYERGIVEGDIPTFNAYVNRKPQCMPLWKFNRHGVARLHAHCVNLLPKKGKKGKK